MSTKYPIYVNIIALNQDDHTKNITEPYSETRDWVEPPKPVVANRPLEEVKKKVIITTIEADGGNKSEIARRLGIRVRKSAPSYNRGRGG